MTVNGGWGNRSVRHCRTARHIKALEFVAADGVRTVADRPVVA
ncbi:hypothetical protein [Streptomyces sp. NBC_00199]|nr:hypothetical protein [Streptomyces sp. NBC_00199]MCX5264817.1 hypothetical protein [Streptomyces sp. NBC_00199]